MELGTGSGDETFLKKYPGDLPQSHPGAPEFLGPGHKALLLRKGLERSVVSDQPSRGTMPPDVASFALEVQQGHPGALSDDVPLELSDDGQ